MILGWDIGGVNTKVARIDQDGRLAARARAFELQRDPEALVTVLRELAAAVGVAGDAPVTCAVTMTAELSQMFRTKGDGVRFVIDAVERAFPRASVRVFAVDGRFLAPAEARGEPLAVAAANWAATARLVARRHPTALLLDIGTTTTDVIPIVDRAVVATGLTDPERLASGELVYTGALRTPVEAIVREVPYGGGRAMVSAEGFALAGDVHVWRGTLSPADYSVTPPDGRPATRDFAGGRLARIVCGDRDMLDAHAISRIAEAVAAAQVSVVSAAVKRVVAAHPSIRTAVVAGLGVFIAKEAAQAGGLDVIALAGEFGDEVARYAPAAAVAILCADEGLPEGGHYTGGLPEGGHYTGGRGGDPPHVDVVVKIGGGLLAHLEEFERVLSAVGEFARTHRVLVVPGGGLFADTVRDVDARIALGDSAAHWMAILAMDQYAHLLASRLASAVIVNNAEEAATALAKDRLPILAPSRWLAAADPLPHTWDITSDSIAAWIAGEVGARHLVLVKPPGTRGREAVDPYLARTLRSDVKSECVAAGDVVALFSELAASS